MNSTNDEPQTTSTSPDFGAATRRERGRRRHVSERIGRLREAGRNLGGQVAEQVQTHPLTSLGAAIGAGFVAGSLLGSRLGQMLLAVGLGYLLRNVTVGDVNIDRIQEGIDRLSGHAMP